MNKAVKVLAFDFGASSGRAMLASYENGTIKLTEMHRFSNDPVKVGNTLYWDVLRLFYEIKQGILKTVNAGHTDIASVGIDTWGVDFALFDDQGEMLGNPVHYRDARTEHMIERAGEILGREKISSLTGIQTIFFNTVYQLLSLVKSGSPALKAADKLLFMPDVFNYFLTGEMTSEYTIASTSALLDASKRTWSDEIISGLSIPDKIFCDVVLPGTVVGHISDDICEELACPKIPVIAVASHDTASAVVSVPAKETDGSFAYLSCGTWSLMGVELDEPVITEKSARYNFTNEGGFGSKIRFIKNIMGLWIIQECRRYWQSKSMDMSFDEMENAAWAATPFQSFIDPDDLLFATPGNMPGKIRSYCEKTGQIVPHEVGEYILCAAQSLALKYRWAVEALEDTLDKKIDVINMIGGGIKDSMLCQFTANATGRTVIAGPVEATAIGNAAVQLISLGAVEGLSDARQVVRNSFPMKVYQPRDNVTWDFAYDEFKKLLG